MSTSAHIKKTTPYKLNFPVVAVYDILVHIAEQTNYKEVDSFQMELNWRGTPKANQMLSTH